MAIFDYDDSQINPAEIFEALPAGKYQACLTECSDKKPCKNGSGYFLKMTFEILSGEFKGRKIFGRFNLWHSNTETQEIARRQVKALKVAVGLPDAVNPQDLYNLPLTVKIKVKPADGEYEASNEIAGFAAKETPAYAAAAAGTSPSVPATPAAPPWAAKK